MTVAFVLIKALAYVGFYMFLTGLFAYGSIIFPKWKCLLLWFGSSFFFLIMSFIYLIAHMEAKGVIDIVSKDMLRAGFWISTFAEICGLLTSTLGSLWLLEQLRRGGAYLKDEP
jgi:hypothetical protein